MVQADYKLTQYSKGSGCGCKIAPAVLREILADRETLPAHPDLLVGYENSDDAAVLVWRDDECLISTVDFFSPIADDPFEYGKIAASNALSDVYAMGGKPLVAIAVLGWPVDVLPAAVAAKVLEGAKMVCRIAGIALAGGHSIESKEPFFGLAVSGIVNKKNLKRNNTAKDGDHLFLTKPLGTGIIAAAAKRDLVRPEDLDSAIAVMSRINNVGEALGKLNGVNAMTDVTGFGLTGHLMEMLKETNLSVEVSVDAVPMLPELEHYTSRFIYPDMTMKNFAAFSSECDGMPPSKLFALCDPQTSGGLLVSVEEKELSAYLNLVREFGLQGIADQKIGQFISKKEKSIYFI